MAFDSKLAVLIVGHWTSTEAVASLTPLPAKRRGQASLSRFDCGNHVWRVLAGG